MDAILRRTLSICTPRRLPPLTTFGAIYKPSYSPTYIKDIAYRNRRAQPKILSNLRLTLKLQNGCKANPSLKPYSNPKIPLL